jgi:hypothetical protein
MIASPRRDPHQDDRQLLPMAEFMRQVEALRREIAELDRLITAAEQRQQQH